MNLPDAIQSSLDGNSLFGAVSFARLGGIARHDLESLKEDKRKAVCYALMALFVALEYDQREMSLSGDEKDAFLKKARPPVARAAAYLRHGGDSQEAVEIVASLAGVHINALPA